MTSISPWAASTAAFASGCIAAAGIAHATATRSIPDSTSGVITACVHKKTGVMRVIDAQAGKKCRTKERTITFNQTGPAGTAGGTGAEGPAGAPGATGTTGATGATGPAGPAGQKGDTGAAGTPGAMGPAGARGPSDAYMGSGSKGVNNAGATVASVTFPTGSYTLAAAGRISFNGSGAGTAICDLNIAGGSGTLQNTESYTGKEVNDSMPYDSMAMVGKAVVTGSTMTVALNCSTSPSLTATVTATVIATRVAELH